MSSPDFSARAEATVDGMTGERQSGYEQVRVSFPLTLLGRADDVIE
jgi:hypothetical protein